MASSTTALLSPSISFSAFNPSLLPLRLLSRSTSGQKKGDPAKKTVVCSQPPSSPVSPNSFPCKRRDFMVFGASLSLALLFPPSGLIAGGEVKMASMVDDLNAYSYMYPMELPSKKFVFKWVESRKPERYSSAAPLSPDARLRIVSERVDIIDNLIISISIGPPNALFLKSKDKSTWAPKDVADSVLSDKSALRITSSQRMAESSILDARSSEIDGEPYWYYEYLIRKSPTQTSQDANLFRHYVSSTAERDGYLYTLSASTISKQWDKMGPYLEGAAASFKLLPPTESYVPPFKDPWRFW